MVGLGLRRRLVGLFLGGGGGESLSEGVEVFVMEEVGEGGVLEG